MEKRDMVSLKRRYLLDIELYERTYKSWEARGRKIVKRYRDERNEMQGADARYNILWSNVQTVLPAVFARLPKPEVSRRYKDKDPVGRVAALLLERALSYEVEQYSDYASAVGNSVEDRLLPGRGVAWVRYEPVTKSVELPSEESDAQITEDVEKPTSAEIIDYECAPVDYVAWTDFGHNVARTWEEVSIVWRRVPLSRAECVARFGKEIGNEIALDQKSDFEDNVLSTPEGETLKKATIYEIWDKKEGIAVWLSKSHPEALDVVDDPLGLDCFFPCPKPLYATTTTDSLIPVADYAQYQDQAREIDTICERIDGLVRAVKVVGVYDATQTGVQRMLQEGVNNTLIPVDNWMMFAEKGGIKGVVEFMPLDMVVVALNALYLAREQVKQTIYEITGISDIIRGATDPNETLGAQQLKGQFASKRLKKLQDNVAQFATELLKIKAQIICKHYQTESIATISGAGQLSQQDQALVPQALELLRDDVMSDFRIEISSDSLIEVDEQQEKQNRMEFIEAVSTFIEKAALAPPQFAPMLGEVLLYGVRAFKAGKTIEGTIEDAVEQAKEQAAQPQEPQPDPEIIKAQMQMQLEQERLKGDQERAQQQMMMDQDMEMKKAELQQQTELKKAALQSKTQVRTSAITAGQADPGKDEENEMAEQLSQIMQAVQMLAGQVHQISQDMMAPVEYERRPDGKVISVRKGSRMMNVSYGPDGRAQGVG
ncbi:hypothetical protein SAMN05216316_1073 [Nitrosovibrio sp. Nv6]|nr:hypothetical protein SAMN05216316_1073 [Nitrosovibrio sp. Nv6]